jgi:hypothetical protein
MILSRTIQLAFVSTVAFSLCGCRTDHKGSTNREQVAFEEEHVGVGSEPLLALQPLMLADDPEIVALVAEIGEEELSEEVTVLPAPSLMMTGATPELAFFEKKRSEEQVKPENLPLAEQINAVRMENIHGKVGGKVTSHRESQGVILSGDFLYWKANEDGLEYAAKITNHTPFTVSNNLNMDAQLKDVKFKWDPGFRVALGYLFNNNDHWDLVLEWTRIHTKAHSEVSSNNLNTTSIQALWAPNVVNYPLNFASSHWRLSYNVLDLSLGRSYFVGKTTMLHPYVGLRGASLRQHLHAKYNGFFFPTPFNTAPVTPITDKFSGKNNYSAAGIRVGSDFLWHFNRYFGLFSDFSASLLCGQFNVKETVTAWQQPTTPIVPSTVKLKEHLNRTRVNVEAAIGFQGEVMFNNEKQRLAFTLAYELSEWFSQNQLIQPFMTNDPQSVNQVVIPTSKNGDLSLQGGTFKIELNF